MTKYEVSVRIDLNYEVEANSQEEAQEQGYLWEDYVDFAEVHSIYVDEIEPDGLDTDE